MILEFLPLADATGRQLLSPIRRLISEKMHPGPRFGPHHSSSAQHRSTAQGLSPRAPSNRGTAFTNSPAIASACAVCHAAKHEKAPPVPARSSFGFSRSQTGLCLAGFDPCLRPAQSRAEESGKLEAMLDSNFPANQAACSAHILQGSRFRRRQSHWG